MINEILQSAYAIAQWDIRLTILLSLVFGVFLTYLITYMRSALAVRRNSDNKSPPPVPYSIPGLGNLFSFAFDTKEFLSNLISRYGPGVPARIRILNTKLHFISGAESVLALFKGSKDLSTAPASILVLQNAFGSPSSEIYVYERDNTGISKERLPGSNEIEPHNRIFYQNHQMLHRYFQGNALVDLADRFMKYLETELLALDISDDEWTELPDFYSVVQAVIFKASTTAIYGPHLFKLNPDFTTDFWKYDTLLPGLFKNFPRWMIPNSYKVRDKLLVCIKNWYIYSREHADAADPSLKDLEWDEFYGARIVRERELFYTNVDGFTEQAQAANDLGLIWGSNGNIVPIIGWEVLDTLFRPELLKQVQTEISACSDPTKTGVAALEMPKLLQSPLLLSIYSEELRLRNGVIIQRVPIVDNFKIGPWKFPKGQMITTSSWHEQRDRKVWNEGPVNGEFHSVDEFWAERFLVYPNDPSTGPRKPSPEMKIKSQKSDEKTLDDKPKFTAATVTGSFIPYGGGEKICPGRFYAKQEAIGALALFLTMFDIELMDKEKPPQMNLEYFPFGVIPPVGKVPVKIRRRRL